MELTFSRCTHPSTGPILTISGLISWWRCYANNYLHWGALATWLLLLVQSCAFYGLRGQIRPTQMYGDAMVWYNMFIIFVMYCMLPVPVKWCTVCCLLTTVIHIVVLAIIVRKSQPSSSPQPHAAWNVFSIGLLYLCKPFQYIYIVVHLNNTRTCALQ